MPTKGKKKRKQRGVFSIRPGPTEKGKSGDAREDVTYLFICRSGGDGRVTRGVKLNSGVYSTSGYSE